MGLGGGGGGLLTFLMDLTLTSPTPNSPLPPSRLHSKLTTLSLCTILSEKISILAISGPKTEHLDTA